MKCFKICAIFFVFVISWLAAHMTLAQTQSLSRTTLIPSESGDMKIIGSDVNYQLTAEKPTDLSLESPALIQLNGRVPLLLVPVSAGKTEIRINPPTIADATGAQSQREISNLLSNLMIEIVEIQRKVQEKRFQQAYDQLVNLQKMYPKIAYLDFIKASVLYLQGKRSEARTAIESALKVHPNFKEGKEFLKQIGGQSE